jgi:hypothetical protein
LLYENRIHPERKNRLTELARVERGRTMVVTRNGQPVFDPVRCRTNRVAELIWPLAKPICGPEESESRFHSLPTISMIRFRRSFCSVPCPAADTGASRHPCRVGAPAGNLAKQYPTIELHAGIQLAQPGLDRCFPKAHPADKCQRRRIGKPAAHATATVEPDPNTRDPFDRFLLAQCQAENLKLATVDRAILRNSLALKA